MAPIGTMLTNCVNGKEINTVSRSKGGAGVQRQGDLHEFGISLVIVT